MIFKIVGIMVMTFIFFMSLYKVSRSDSWKGMLWTVIGVLSIAAAALFVVLTVIPNFFQRE